MADDEVLALYDPDHPDHPEDPVDPDGRVVGSARRDRVRAENLPHAATAVLVRNGAGEVYVHRRTETKDVYPGLHDVWAGGCVGAGERPDDAAARELAEELGIVGATLEPVYHAWYRDDQTHYLAFVYEARWDGPIVHQADEVADGWWMSWDDLIARLADPAWPFAPDGRVGLERYMDAKGAR